MLVKIIKHLSTYQIVALTFLLLILVGTALLMLPAASTTGQGLSFIDALFMATSAVCVTGLTVVDTGIFFTTFGQMVVIVLVQLGGLGIMTFATMVSVAFGKRINLRERLLIQEALNQETVAGVVRMALNIVKYTFIIEFFFGSILAIHFYKTFGLQGIYFGYWHAISAFCNAGFDLFGNYTSLMPFASDTVVNLCIVALITLGSIGFIVIEDVLHKPKFIDYSLHSKIVIVTTIALGVFGTIAFWLMEMGNPDTLAHLSGKDQFLASVFHSVSPRSGGFNTVPVDQMEGNTLLLLIIFMLIGASSTSTGGGIKTTTCAVVLLSVWNILRGKNECVVFNRRISRKSIDKAFAITILAVLFVVIITLIVSTIEELPVMHVLFEVAAAFGTTGLSIGVTHQLSDLSKLILVATMYAGRVGVLTFAMVLMQKHEPDKIKYPEGKIIIG